MRYHQHGLGKFKIAAKDCNESKVDFTVNLFDIIDGFSNIESGITNIVDVIKQFKLTGISLLKRGKIL